MPSSCTARTRSGANPTPTIRGLQTWEERVQIARELEEAWGEDVDLSSMWPNAAPDEAAWFQRRGRASLSPCGCARSHPDELEGGHSRGPCRPCSARLSCSTAPAISTPTWRRAAIIAEHIRGARFVELNGDDHVPFVDPDQILDEVEEFLTGVRPTPATDRVLATVLFTDLVGSTERATTLGDAAWASLLARHDATVRDELARFGGEEIDTAGDGFLAMFDGPARAIRCGLSIRGALEPLGLDVRAGVHTGEVERPAGEQAARHRCPRRRADHVARGSRRGLRELDDARPRGRVGPRVRGSRRARAEGRRRRPARVRRRSA